MPGERGDRHEGRRLGHLVFVTQAIDPGHPVLGVSIDLVNALAEVASRVTVVANEVRDAPESLPAEVISLGKETGSPRWRRAARYVHVVECLTRRRGGDATGPGALLAHMCPAYLELGAPLARVHGVRSLLWYTQARASRSLHVAEQMADVILTTVPGSYPGSRQDAHAIGHAIDTGLFRFDPLRRRGPLRLLALGRTSMSKRLSIAICGVERARRSGFDVTLRIVGPSVTPSEVAVRQELAELAGRLRLGEAVTIEDPVPRDRVPELIRSCDALVSTTADGSADKVVFEAMAMGRPVLFSNPALASLADGLPLDLRFRTDDPEDFARALVRLDRADAADLITTAERLSARVAAGHSVGHWAARVAELAAGPGGQASGLRRARARSATS